MSGWESDSTITITELSMKCHKTEVWTILYGVWNLEEEKKTSQEMNKLSRRFVNRIAFFSVTDWMQIISLEWNNLRCKWYKVVSTDRYILDGGHHSRASEKYISEFYSSIFMLLQHYPVYFEKSASKRFRITTEQYGRKAFRSTHKHTSVVSILRRRERERKSHNNNS